MIIRPPVTEQTDAVIAAFEYATESDDETLVTIARALLAERHHLTAPWSIDRSLSEFRETAAKAADAFARARQRHRDPDARQRLGELGCRLVEQSEALFAVLERGN